MPSSYLIDPVRRITRVTFTGPTDTASLSETRHLIEREPDYDRSGGILVDMSAADLREMNPHALRARASLEPIAFSMAILVSSDADFGLARMYELAGEMVHPREVAVFRSRDEAESWLSRSVAAG